MERLRKLNADQSGAIAMMVMAALLILMMFGWILWDAGKSARDAIDVQYAADSAAWSQASVESRSMNMIAFANVGKRVTYGMTSFYVALWIAYFELLVIAVVLTVACWIVDVITFGAITSICEKLTIFTAELGIVIAYEAPDLATFAGDLETNYFKKDMEAFDKYQAYMAGLTPWWSWSEGMMRGARNGALLTMSWPVPKPLITIDSLMAGETDALPVEKGGWDSYIGMCARIYTSNGIDIAAHLADYAFKNLESGTATDGEIEDWPRPVIFIITALLAAVQLPAGCAIQAVVFGDVGTPYELKEYSSLSEWMKDSSKIVFGYRPNPGAMNNDRQRKKYNYLSADYDTLPVFGELIYDRAGSWSIARSEFSFQGQGSPDMWHASWTARMRPVATPGEWSGLSNITLSKAWRDAIPYITIVGEILGVLQVATHQGESLTDMLIAVPLDELRADSAFAGLNDYYIEGFPK